MTNRRRFSTSLLVLTLVLGTTLGFAGSTVQNVASAANKPPRYRLLHLRSSGPRVATLQWLLGGHKPSKYTSISTFAHEPNGYFGARTAKAVVAMKWRLGFPSKAGKGPCHGRPSLLPIAGDDLFGILKGQRARPPTYIYCAAQRLNNAARTTVITKRTACANRVIRVALAEVGVRETWGRNWGPRVRDYQSVTGAYRAPWCASFDQWVFKTSGYGTFASRSAGVAYIHDYAYRHAWLHAIPRPGALVMFNYGQHIGIIVRVDAHGVQTVEGNHSDSVAYVYRPYGSIRMAYAWLPGCFS